LGLNPERFFSRIGFVPEEACPPEFLTSREYLDFIARCRVKDSGRRKALVTELFDWFELMPKRISHLSKGMRRRLVLAQALLGDPELLILDEPLTGLDPLLIYKLREKLVEFREKGGAILFSSHILAEVEKVCTDIVMLSQGELVCEASVEKLKADHGTVEKAFAEKVGGLS
jgi:ABC-2 type transport system ATP-binding protein